MLRTVSVNKRDVCPGDIPRTVEYELDDSMTIPEFLRFIADDFLWPYLHYQWEIRARPHVQPLGYIPGKDKDSPSELNAPGDVVAFLNQTLQSDDRVQCCVSPELTLKDLDITDVACVDIDRVTVIPVGEQKAAIGQKTDGRSKARHGKGIAGLLERYFGK